MNKEKLLKRLAREEKKNPRSGHSKNLRAKLAKLGISDTPAPAPVVEEVKPMASKKKTSKKKSSWLGSK